MKGILVLFHLVPTNIVYTKLNMEEKKVNSSIKCLQNAKYKKMTVMVLESPVGI